MYFLEIGMNEQRLNKLGGGRQTKFGLSSVSYCRIVYIYTKLYKCASYTYINGEHLCCYLHASYIALDILCEWASSLADVLDDNDKSNFEWTAGTFVSTQSQHNFINLTAVYLFGVSK